MAPQIRFATPQDQDQVAHLIKRVFPVLAALPDDIWMDRASKYVVVAQDGEKIVGAIPFEVRPFVIRPGVNIAAAFCYAVSTHADYRSQGIGSLMMKFARQNFTAFCDALFVYTGNEGQQPYTFYERNQFVDLLYSRWYTASQPTVPSETEAEIQPFNPAAWDGELLNCLFQAQFAAYGGFKPRTATYWAGMPGSIIFPEYPCQLYIATLPGQSGYILFGQSEIFCQGDRTMVILEFAFQPGMESLVAPLLNAVVRHSLAVGATQVRIPVCHDHPLLDALPQAGFHPEARQGAEVLAAQVIRPVSVWQKISQTAALPAVSIWTPARQIGLPGEGEALQLEMKEAMLTRLLLGRSEVKSAQRVGEITTPGPRQQLERLEAAFPYTPWVFHYTDWT